MSNKLTSWLQAVREYRVIFILTFGTLVIALFIYSPLCPCQLATWDTRRICWDREGNPKTLMAFDYQWKVLVELGADNRWVETTHKPWLIDAD